MAEWLRRLTHIKSYFLVEGGNRPELLFIFYFSHLSKKTFRQSDMYRTLGEKIWSDSITWPVYRHTWLNYRQFRPLSPSAVCKLPKSISQSNSNDVIQCTFDLSLCHFLRKQNPLPFRYLYGWEIFNHQWGNSGRVIPIIGFILDISQPYKYLSKRF